MKKNLCIISLLYLAVLVSACAPAATATPTPPPPASAAPGETRTLTLMTHDSFAVSEEVIQAFEKENDVTVKVLQSGDTGAALNKAILSKSNPLADVFYGVDNTFLSRALEEGIFDAYPSLVLSQIPSQFQLDSSFQALPVDYGDVCLNYDRAYFEEKGIAPPQSLEDLLKPEYKGLTVVQNPATSSPGMAFLLATIGHFGTEEYLTYWDGLVDNALLVVNDWETAYNTEFTRAGGARPIVVSYSSSPAFEVLYATTPVTEPQTAAVVSPGSCFRQIEFVGILKGTPNRDLAEKWVDFMLSPTFQSDIPLQMFVFPVNPQAKLDEVFVKYLAVPEETAQVSPEDIAQNRENWVQLWTEAVLR